MPIRVLWATLAALLAACGGGGQMAGPPEPAPGGAATTVSGELTVFAAASLTDAFEEIGRRFEEAHPGVRVTFNVASSSTLATQITQGAPADVFASADQAQMDAVDDADLVAGERTTFASNSLQIAVEPGNPRGIESLEDLTRDDVTVVLAAEEVPAGEYVTSADGRQVLDALGFSPPS